MGGDSELELIRARFLAGEASASDVETLLAMIDAMMERLAELGSVSDAP